ncbi:MAG: ribbon-helix-helix domain-containing protein [Sarcina sp.]
MALKNRTKLTSSLDTSIYKDLDKLSELTRIPKSKLLDEAIQLLLEKHNYTSTK